MGTLTPPHPRMQPCLEHWLAPTPNRIKIVVSVQTETLRLFLQPFLYFRLFLQPFLFSGFFFSHFCFFFRLFLQPFLFSGFFFSHFCSQAFSSAVFCFQAKKVHIVCPSIERASSLTEAHLQNEIQCFSF